MILVTGASGAIGSRLVPSLLEAGRPVRVSSRAPWLLEGRWPAAEVVALDVMRADTLAPALRGVTAAYYLVHSMEPGAEGTFHERDVAGARTFARAAKAAGVERVIYLSALGSERDALSEHLWSRQETGRVLAAEGPPLLELRAAMVISRESASFRMLTDLVRRLPAMVLPRWVSTPTQPIALDDVLAYLERSLEVPLGEHHTIVEIGGPDVLTYREMIERAGALVGRRPALVDVPVLTPRLSSYWTGLTTSVPPALARPLIEGMSTRTVVTSDAAARLFPDVHPVGFDEAMRRAAEGA
ncbi:MAG: NAD(P)H-binding protein [Planctomycetaceae bacterium]